MQPRPTRITLKEIATLTGVNVSTVSRALSGAYGVNAETRDRVLAVALQYNYRPNLIARGLVTGRSHTFGLLVSDVRNPFFAEVARGAEDAAFAASYDLILCNSDLNQEKQTRYIHSLVDKNVGGILMHSGATFNSKEREELTNSGLPIVLLNRLAAKHPFSSVLCDNHHGGFLAATHLLELGHRTIAHLTGPRSHCDFAERTRGFLEALQASNAKVTPIVLNGQHTSEGGYGMTEKLLAQHPNVTAIFAANDAIAVGVIRAATECGIAIPDDISLVGFDDIEMSRLIAPPLTTVHQPMYEIGQAAVEILLKAVHSKGSRAAEHRLFGVTLIERKSCRAL